jgi:chromosome segregation ATPase
MDMLKSSRDEDSKRRDEVQFYNMQQQLDDLRRQLRENLARQQWFEELYKQSESKVTQVQTAQDRLTQDIAQAMHARQIDEARMKAQIAELAQQAESPEKQFRELRAQIQSINDARKNDLNTGENGQRQLEDVQSQIREINAHVGKVTDAQRQLRDLIQELDSAIGEVRQEALHLAELQSMEEQRLRRQGMELQGLFEALRQQFGEVAAKSQRVDEVRRQLTERIESTEEQLTFVRNSESTTRHEIERVEKTSNEQYLLQQERVETLRSGIEAQLSEMRQINDQRMDRIMTRFTGVDERMRTVEQMLGEIPSRFEALEHRDEVLGSEADMIEEWLVQRQVAALESVLEDVRKRRAERAPALKPGVKGRQQPTDPTVPGSVYNPGGLLKSVRDARPPAPKDEDDTDEE